MTMSKRVKDITGQRFGMLVVEEFAGIDPKFGSAMWKCKCDCGNEKIVRSRALISGDTVSCGCKRKNDLTGKRFGRLLVVKKIENNSPKDRNGMYECVCDCGNKTIAYQSNLLQGKTTSCGCFQKEEASKRFSTHGMTKTRLYKTYFNMKQRCLDQSNKSYHNYGGRGIKICEEWMESFLNFANWALSNGYSDSLTLDRIDVNGDYCPENCRWATIKEQSNNQRKTIWVEILGNKKSLKEWTNFMEWPYGRYEARHLRGAPIFKEEEIEQITEKLKKEGVLCPANQSVPCAENCESPRTCPSPGEILS